MRANGERTVAVDALNDLVVSRGASGRAVRLELSLDGVFVTHVHLRRHHRIDAHRQHSLRPVGRRADRDAGNGRTGGGGDLSAYAQLAASGCAGLDDGGDPDRQVGGPAGGPPWTGRTTSFSSRANGSRCGAVPRDVPVIHLPDYDAYSVLDRKLGWGGR